MQVREHTESTLRQYALADTAVALGRAPRDVEVIDRDLGLSGTSAAHRQGFRELMSRVCLGEIGAVFGLEIPRLGRSNTDLARLAEMARLTGTLLIDSDGVYDLGADPQHPGYLDRVDVLLEHLRGLQPQLLSAGPSLSGQAATIWVPHISGVDPPATQFTQARRL